MLKVINREYSIMFDLSEALRFLENGKKYLGYKIVNLRFMK